MKRCSQDTLSLHRFDAILKAVAFSKPEGTIRRFCPVVTASSKLHVGEQCALTNQRDLTAGKFEGLTAKALR